jgi:hypothetical protein
MKSEFPLVDCTSFQYDVDTPHMSKFGPLQRSQACQAAPSTGVEIANTGENEESGGGHSTYDSSLVFAHRTPRASGEWASTCVVYVRMRACMCVSLSSQSQTNLDSYCADQQRCIVIRAAQEKVSELAVKKSRSLWLRRRWRRTRRTRR